MTIPIRPGPFSFLAQLGQAGGEAVAAASKEEDKLKKEAQNRLNMMLTLRSQGLIKPDVFSTPEAMQIYKRLGILPVSDKPNAADMINTARNTFAGSPGSLDISPLLQGAGSALMPKIPISGPEAVSDPMRALAQLPSRAAIGKEQAQAAAMAAGGAAGHVASGVPSEQVAAAQEAGTVAQAGSLQAKFLNDEADSFVAQALAGVDPRKYGTGPGGPERAAEAAYQLYLADATANKIVPMPPETAKRYFNDAVQRRIDYLVNQQIAAMRAIAYSQGVGQNNPYLRDLDRQIDNARADQIRAEAAMKEIETGTLRGIGIDQARKWAASGTGGYNETVRRYDEAADVATAARLRVHDLGSKYELGMQGNYGGGVPGGYSVEEDRREWDASAAEMRSRRPDLTIDQLNKALGRPRP